MVNDISLVKVYLDYQTKFEKEYGEKSIVLMQVGAFFEMYGIDNKKEKIGNLKKISEILNIILTRKRKCVVENSVKNPQMCGFQLSYLKRHLNILLDNDYTVIVIEQHKDNKQKRSITNIFSPGVNIDTIKNSDANNIVSLFIDTQTCYKSGRKIMVLGCCSIDLSTGKNIISQSHELINDKLTLFEDMNRFVLIHNPSEILINMNELDEDLVENIEMNSNFSSRKVHNRIGKGSGYSKISFQNSFLNKIFKETNGLSPLEYLNLEMKQTATLSYMDLLQFCYEHNPNILNRIQKPEIWDKNEHLILYNDAIYQLDLIRNNVHLRGNTRIKSLFDLLCFTKTSMGRRLLKYRITNPITNIEVLNKRYNMIDILKNDEGMFNSVRDGLKKIVDIQRYYRKLLLKKLHPFEFYTLDITHKSILNIIDILKDSDLSNLCSSDIEKFNEYIKEYTSCFNMKEIGKYSLDDINGNFVQDGISDSIKKIDDNIKNLESCIDKERKRLIKLLDIQTKNNSCPISLHISSEKKEYNFQMTKTRFNLLKKKKGFQMDEKSLYEPRTIGNNIKFFNTKLRGISKYILDEKRKLKEEVKEFYLEKLEYFSNKYGTVLNRISNYISEIDVIQSCVKCALEYGYCKPELVENEVSFFDCKKIRHPILERLPFSGEYVTNDLGLGFENKCGLLLYGVNGSGKSSLSKAVGLNIIMAQSGMYVPSSEFKLAPYNKIFTRITSDDNLFKGKSSFAVEMSELRSILKFADKNSIVLGDEVCKGTEQKSALSIINASLNFFVKNKINFILATHFHKLYNLLDDYTEVKEKILFKHLSIERKDDTIIYGRKLQDGIGGDIYGLEIAKHIIDNDEFIRIANESRNKILGLSNNILDNNHSNYNSDVIVDKCAICGRGSNEMQLDTHHIKEQHRFNENKLMGHIKKDNYDNLVVLCKYHHNEVHNGKLEINGYMHTNKGRILDYNFKKTKTTNKKYNQEQIDMIQSKYGKQKYTKKYILDCLEKDGLKMSKTTLTKILKGTY